MDLKETLRLVKSANRRKALDERRVSINEAGTGTGAARDPKTTRVKIVTPKIGGAAGGQFEESPIDLQEIGRAYHGDSYVRRAIDKINGLMFKSGWGLVSLNSDALEYVEMRLRLIEESTGISTEELLRELGVNYILYSNAPIVKTRGQENLGGLQASGYYGGEPISGLFPASPEYFQVLRDDFGNVEGYTIQGDGGGQGVEFSVEDISHMTYHKPTGRAYGVPYIQNVIDDVLILRQVEENVARLIYRNLFPLQVYRVGLAEPGYEATDDEIEEVTEMIRNMPIDGMVVLPERHEIKTVGTDSGLNAYEYLRYFRQRVFTGLGVSESTMGIGDSGNKSTSDNQSSDLIDLVKDFQQSFSAEVQRELINEILFEGGYDPTLVKEDRVEFTFTEIEQTAKIARENHEIQKFLSNIQSLDEARQNSGYQPTTDFSNFYFNLVGTGGSTNESAGGTVSSKDQPENQAGKQLNPNKDTVKDAVNMEKNNSILTEHDQKVSFTTDNVKKSENRNRKQEAWLWLKAQLILEMQKDERAEVREQAISKIFRTVLGETSVTEQSIQTLTKLFLFEATSAVRKKMSLEESLYAFQITFYSCYEQSLQKEKEEYDGFPEIRKAGN